MGLEGEGLLSALRELAHTTGKRAGLEVTCECRTPVKACPSEIGTHLFRIAQEAVNNALKHARASRLGIALAVEGERVSLTVRDNGRGLPARLPAKRGMGLRIMQYRAAMIGGTLEIGRDPAGGTSVCCSLIAPHAAPAGSTTGRAGGGCPRHAHA
jgi:signal transduction histidine kinase